MRFLSYSFLIFIFLAKFLLFTDLNRKVELKTPEVEKFNGVISPFNFKNLKIESPQGEAKFKFSQEIETEKSILFNFDKEICFIGDINRDISGYEGFEVVLSSSAGIITLEVVDCFQNIWQISKKNVPYNSSLKFKFDEFIPIETKNDFGFKQPSSIESLSFKFKRLNNQSENQFLVKSIKAFGSRGMAGPSISVDPLFDFYKERKWLEIADLLKCYGYTNVVIVFTRDMPYDKHREIVDAFHSSGLKCTIRINPPTDFEAYERHPEWRQRMLDGSAKYDWRVYLCPNNENFTKYYCAKIANILKNVPYDCLSISELWFEVWGGAYRNNTNKGKYACLCDKCVEAFKIRTHIDPRELFNEKSPLYFELPENSEIYQKWVNFRADTINRFCGQIVEEAKNTRPDIKISYMYLSDCTVEPGKTREYQAQDFEGALKASQADYLVIQDAWQDWIKTNLSPDFVKNYAKAYIQRAKAVKPDIIIQAHADNGSIPAMKRSELWMRQFSAYSRCYGFNSPTYYEFSLTFRK